MLRKFGEPLQIEDVPVPDKLEAGAEWVSTDRDFAKFTGLRWMNPLA